MPVSLLCASTTRHWALSLLRNKFFVSSDAVICPLSSVLLNVISVSACPLSLSLSLSLSQHTHQHFFPFFLMITGLEETFSWVCSKLYRFILFSSLLFFPSDAPFIDEFLLLDEDFEGPYLRVSFFKKRLSPLKFCTYRTYLILRVTAWPKKHHVQACAKKCHKIPWGQVGFHIDLTRATKTAKSTTHQKKTSTINPSCPSVNVFVQDEIEKPTLQRLNKRQNSRDRPPFPRLALFLLLSISKGPPILVTCQGSDCKI